MKDHYVKHTRFARPRLYLLLALMLLFASAAGSALAAPAAEAPLPMPPTPEASLAEMQAMEDIEAAYQPSYLSLATGDALAAHATYAWPFDVSFTLGHAIQSYQYYGSTAAYFHHGIDIMPPSRSRVYCRSGGQVVKVYQYDTSSSVYWEVAVLDPEGYLWQYHHIDNSTIPQAIWDAYTAYQANPTTGGFISANTYIGNIVWWSTVSFGYNFHHVHLNILASGGQYLNGFEFMTPLADTVAPTIRGIGLLKNNTPISGNETYGDYGLYVRASDLVLNTVYTLPPYKVVYSLDGGADTTVWEFANLPGGGDRYLFPKDYYVVPPTCGNYTCRDFYIDLGFTTAGQRAFPMTAGQHSVHVTVYDYAGNSAAGDFAWTVLTGTTVFFDDFEDAAPTYTWTRNPNGADTATSLNAGWWETANPAVTTYTQGDTYSYGEKQLDTTASGVKALVTGGSSSSYDLDGATSIRSPDITLPDSANIEVSFYSYFAHTASSTADTFRVTVVEPAAAQAVAADTAGLAPDASTVIWQEQGSSSQRDAVWTFHRIPIPAYRNKTIYLLIEAADASPATTIVEAAVDDVQIARSSPLAVDLSSFTADAAGGGVALAWETVSEVDNAGFNIYRADSADGPWIRLNETLIPVAAPGSSEGRAYTWTDDTVSAGTYWYALEDVALNGATSRYDPVSVTAGAPGTEPAAPNAVGLAGFGAATGAAAMPSLAGLAAALSAVALAALTGVGLRRKP